MEKGVDDTLQTLTTLYHMHNERPFKIPVVLRNVINELFEATAYSTYQIIIFDIASNSVVANKVESVSDMEDRDRNWLGFDKFVDGHVNIIAFTRHEVDRTRFEQFITLGV